MKNFILITTFIISSAVYADGNVIKGPEDDALKINDYQQRCEVINTLLIKDSFKLGCFSNYNHYGPTSKQIHSESAFKIANYNLLHPGTSKALFKDYAYSFPGQFKTDASKVLEDCLNLKRTDQ